jgi:hypothetical protein
METFSIETDGMGGYQVRVNDSEVGGGHIVGSFPTWRHASEWIDGRTTGQSARMTVIWESGRVAAVGKRDLVGAGERLCQHSRH